MKRGFFVDRADRLQWTLWMKATSAFTAATNGK